MIESIEMLELIASPEEPPMNVEAIERIRNQTIIVKLTSEQKGELKGMESAFRHRGDLHRWNPELLGKIDDIFVECFMKDQSPKDFLFYVKNEDYANQFLEYCMAVDSLLMDHSAMAPEYAREYFAYYTIWQMRGYKFPMPLGTTSVISAPHTILKECKDGFGEVSSGFTSFVFVRCNGLTHKLCLCCLRSEWIYVDGVCAYTCTSR